MTDTTHFRAFVSYRRADSLAWVERILDVLRVELGGRVVFQEESKGTLHVCGGALFIGRFRSTGFLNTWKSRPEFEKQVPNQRKEVKDRLSRRST